MHTNDYDNDNDYGANTLFTKRFIYLIFFKSSKLSKCEY